MARIELYDETHLKKMIDESKNPEEMRKRLNKSKETLNKFINEIITSMENLNKLYKLKYNINKNDEIIKEYADNSRSLVCTILANAMQIYGINEVELNHMVQTVIENVKNIAEQQKGETKNV